MKYSFLSSKLCKEAADDIVFAGMIRFYSDKINDMSRFQSLKELVSSSRSSFINLMNRACHMQKFHDDKNSAIESYLQVESEVDLINSDCICIHIATNEITKIENEIEIADNSNSTSKNAFVLNNKDYLQNTRLVITADSLVVGVVDLKVRCRLNAGD